MCRRSSGSRKQPSQRAVRVGPKFSWFAESRATKRWARRVRSNELGDSPEAASDEVLSRFGMRSCGNTTTFAAIFTADIVVGVERRDRRGSNSIGAIFQGAWATCLLGGPLPRSHNDATANALLKQLRTAL